MNKALKAISLAVMLAFSVASAPALGQQQQNASPKAKGQKVDAAQGSSTPGRIAKFRTPGALDRFEHHGG